MSANQRPPDELDRLAESLRLAWAEIERLKHDLGVLQIKHDDFGRRVRQSWSKQGETNTRLTQDLEHHIHPTYITGPTGEPQFAVADNAALAAQEGGDGD